MNGRSCAGRLSCATGPSLIGLTVAGVLMSRLLLTDEPPMAYCRHCGQPMKLMSVSRLLSPSYPTRLELYGSAPWSVDDGQLNDWNDGRGIISRIRMDSLELMTVPQ
jgi:hypothetical protein